MCVTNDELKAIVNLVKHLKKYNFDELDDSLILFIEKVYSELDIVH